MERRSFIAGAVAALPFALQHAFCHGERREGAGRHGRPGPARTTSPTAAGPTAHWTSKWSPRETNGGLFVMEHRNLQRGGPPLHMHHDQEEWFYLMGGGEMIVKVGDQELRMKPGDSILAPRKVPHTWAYVGDTPGQMIIAFTPRRIHGRFFPADE